jgi:hypothetical protein
MVKVDCSGKVVKKKKRTKYSFQKQKAPTLNTSTNKRNASLTSLSNVPCVSTTSDNVLFHLFWRILLHIVALYCYIICYNFVTIIYKTSRIWFNLFLRFIHPMENYRSIKTLIIECSSIHIICLCIWLNEKTRTQSYE